MGNCVNTQNRINVDRSSRREQLASRSPAVIPQYNPPCEFKEDCIVCMERKINVVIIPCGHCVVCYACITSICELNYESNRINKTANYPKCPMCRNNIEALTFLYPKMITIET